MRRPSLEMGATALALTLALAAPIGVGARAADETGKLEPAHVEPIPGTELSRVTLTEQAFKRLGIETSPVREERVARTRTVGGIVLEPGSMALLEPAAAGGAAGAGPKTVVRVEVSGDVRELASRQPALVRPLYGGAGHPGLRATPLVTAPGETMNPEESLHFAVDDPQGSLAGGQQVLVELTLSAGSAPRPVVPISAVIYDEHGEEWVYMNPEPLAYHRHHVDIDFLTGELAVLNEGPAAGAMVVTLGAPLLLGTEFEIGH